MAGPLSPFGAPLDSLLSFLSDTSEGQDNFPALLECQLLDPRLTMNAAPDICQKTYNSAEGRVADFLELTKPTLVNGRAFLRNDMSDNYVPDSDDSGDRGSDGSEYVLDSDEDNGSKASDSDAASCITVGEDGGDLEDGFYMQEDWEVGRDEVLAIFD
ncbi:hypothetical protein DFH08DRAFT_806579 [Mycena albidolilacea]|uniref:Uncharacterized protein n=1 Tax=Mycena albidolilacea TaxID=1033008 RepID=A0AAD7A7A2_9AGAR|nr:hypothetical protein DFH08DRAFT_806579 [Mycena albidolilacea]